MAVASVIRPHAHQGSTSASSGPLRPGKAAKVTRAARPVPRTSDRSIQELEPLRERPRLAARGTGWRNSIRRDYSCAAVAGRLKTYGGTGYRRVQTRPLES